MSAETPSLRPDESKACLLAAKEATKTTPTVHVSIPHEEAAVQLATTPNTPSRSRATKSKWTRVFRVVEQNSEEPLAVILFKWLLIVVGVAMLALVLLITLDVLYVWSTEDTANNENNDQKEKGLFF